MPAFHDHELWTSDEGAPSGHGFDIRVPSSRAGRGPYRIMRDPRTGTIAHKPACEAFRHGHHNCRHVRQAIEQAEHPETVFLRVASEAVRRELAGEAHMGEEGLEISFRAFLQRAVEAAQRQLADNAIEAEDRNAWGLLTPAERAEDALAEFGGVS